MDPDPAASNSTTPNSQENTNPQIGKTIAAVSNKDLVNKLLDLAEVSACDTREKTIVLTISLIGFFRYSRRLVHNFSMLTNCFRPKT